ncbi:hypothetical protein X474_07135 [Dethiosulfatarculus sandiegensis]|uniref:Uncharacterized protein n=1 Tax=Dethiosulfatarculus sandiegensis TaxID=1429043 RepID=A0A0D2JZF7_9BACT|nr:hypothetical protein X474_07135 [Dethiosulfatarculus sandiegensis]
MPGLQAGREGMGTSALELPVQDPDQARQNQGLVQAELVI